MTSTFPVSLLVLLLVLFLYLNFVVPFTVMLTTLLFTILCQVLLYFLFKWFSSHTLTLFLFTLSFLVLFEGSGNETKGKHVGHLYLYILILLKSTVQVCRKYNVIAFPFTIPLFTVIK